MPRRLRVLVADDYPDVAKAVGRLLAVDCEVVGTVADGSALLEAAQRLQPDVVVLDLNLPKVHGLEVCRQITQLHPRMKVIVFTATDDPTVTERSLAFGATAFVSKLAHGDLLSAIRRLCVDESVAPRAGLEPATLVRRFECFTADLHRLADWLQQCGVTTVAMQSTGVYWIPLYEILDARGLEVYLVNARHTKNLPGRKPDVQESQWLLKLHTYGLLRNSFPPSADIRIVRTYWRQRGGHVQAVSTCIQRMQKVLTQMNVQLANVISDLSGWTGQRIVRAILAGERDPQTLAALSHPGIHATRDQIARSLEGTWQSDLLFVLQQEVTMYDAYLQRIAECDHALEHHLKTFANKAIPDAPSNAGPSSPVAPRQTRVKHRRKAGSHTPQFNLGHELHRISGVDLTRIDGIDVGVAQTVISEVGVDMTRWKTEAHFASWLGLCPDNRITGGKVIRKGTRHVINRAATALRLAATTLLRSHSYLGAQYRRLRARLGAPKAITAMAHKLARLVYRMLKWGHEYVDKGLQYYEERHRDQQVQLLKKRAAKLGLQIVDPDAA